MLREPVISILLPAYNALRWIEGCLNSLLGQSFSSFEIIVVDDGSTDGTADAVLSFAMADARVQLHRMPVNQGIVRALNYGLAHCKGDFVARMDADDVAIRDRLLKQHSFLLQWPDVDLIGSQVESIDEEGRVLGLSRQPLSHRAIVRALPLTSPILHPAWMARKSVFKRLCGYRDLAPVEDYDFLMRLYRSGGRFLNHPDVLVQMRIHAANTQSTCGLKQRLARRQVYRAVMGGHDLTKAELDRLCYADAGEQRRYAEANDYLTRAILSRSRLTKIIECSRAALAHREVARYMLERCLFKLLSWEIS